MQVVCTVTNEVTALAVAKELKDEAVIVFPLTTAQSVATSHLRRELPAHVMGAAIGRNSGDLREYLDEAWPALLRWEQESTASSYSGLFDDLTRYVTDCLDARPFIGHVSGEEVDLKIMTHESRKLFVYRLSRSYARRALQIDRQSLDIHRRDVSPWWKILERARDMTLMKESEDRLFVRDRLRLMLVEAFGEETELQLTPSRLEYLIPLLEQEFDIELQIHDLMHPVAGKEPARASPTIETLTSAIQRVMERSSVVTLHSRVVEVTSDLEDVLSGLHAKLAVELNERGDDHIRSTGREREGSSMLARYRGNYVGCVDICSVGRQAFQLRNLYVERILRKNGLGRILIRTALEYAAAKKARTLLIDLHRVPSKSESDEINKFFERNGFRREGDNGPLKYTLLRGGHEATPRDGACVTSP